MNFMMAISERDICGSSPFSSVTIVKTMHVFGVFYLQNSEWNRYSKALACVVRSATTYGINLFRYQSHNFAWFTTLNPLHWPYPLKLHTSWTIDVFAIRRLNENRTASKAQASHRNFHVWNSHHCCVAGLFQTTSYDWLLLSNGWFSCFLVVFVTGVRCHHWEVAVITWWTRSHSVSSTPRSRELWREMLRGGSSSVKRFLLLGMIRRRIELLRIWSISRSCAVLNLASTDVIRWVADDAFSIYLSGQLFHNFFRLCCMTISKCTVNFEFSTLKNYR